MLADREGNVLTMKRSGARVHVGVVEFACEKCGRTKVINLIPVMRRPVTA